MLSGKVILYNEERGFGFIRPDNGDVDVFIHIRAAREGGINELAVGDRLEFLVERDERSGKPRAAEIRPAPAG
ncbi:MAG TPA: cold shock domain-containing protein [Stellaceae bacterium]|nr:cold shock domain-containing protein [Stellaceae bacterium]